MPDPAERRVTMATLRASLSRECESAGGQSAWARRHCIPVSQVCEAISGRRDLSPALVNALGFLRVERFIPANEATA